MSFALLSDGAVVVRPTVRRHAELAGSLTRTRQPLAKNRY